jgi:signal transduction histidine kinase
MRRILFEPKRRLLVRTMLAFAVVLALQAGLSGYWVFGALDRLLQTNIDHRLLRMAALAASEPLIQTALATRPEEPGADGVLGTLTNYLNTLTPLVDARGAYVYRVEENRLWYVAGTANVAAGEALPALRVTSGDIAVLVGGRTVLSQPFRRMKGGLLKAVYVPVRRQGQLLGLLAIEDDARDLELVNNLRRQLWLTALGAFVIMGVVATLVAGTIVRPVSRLVAAAAALGQGNFQARFTVAGNDEINFLGQTVNDMAEDIAARDEQIRRMNEAALADAQQLYLHVLRASHSAILTADTDDVVTSENPAAERLLGPRRPERRAMAERLADYPPLLALWQAAAPASQQELTLNVEGEERVVEATVAPLRDHRDEPIGRSLTLLDRTELKRLERELAMRERLAALGELAAGIAHEIRNPLNGIELMLGLVQEDLAAKGVLDERFTRIHDEVSRLNSILNDFLLFARPKPLDREPADLAELAEDALMLLAPAIEDKRIEVTRQYDRAAPAAVVDAGAIRRTLVNLIKNACEAMPLGGKLCVTIEGPAARGGPLRVEVRDNGPGIPDDVRDRIFHPFVTTKDEGTGLGLAIVHKTIVNHGGSIVARNAAEGGASFLIELPNAEAA